LSQFCPFWFCPFLVHKDNKKLSQIIRRQRPLWDADLFIFMSRQSKNKDVGSMVPKMGDKKGDMKMELVTKMFIRARESVVRNTRGQTMTEYALILAAIAVVVYGTYKALGNNIATLASGVDSALTNA
jgi:Flp pilus assembly pilin Flp